MVLARHIHRLARIVRILKDLRLDIVKFEVVF